MNSIDPCTPGLGASFKRGGRTGEHRGGSGGMEEGCYAPGINITAAGNT